ncbi:MAG TPA: response regulator transcription factor [Candidatus Angelobacter sp.]
MHEATLPKIPPGITPCAHKGTIIGLTFSPPQHFNTGAETEFSNCIEESVFQISGVCPLDESIIRVLLVEDHQAFRRFTRSVLEQKPELQIVYESSDGLEAVHRAAELQPDLIVLDIGLPSLNGIEAARQISKLSPKSRILFFTQHSSADMVQAAFNAGALGYVIKIHAASELLGAVEAVCQGRQFISKAASGHIIAGTATVPGADGVNTNGFARDIPSSQESEVRSSKS